MWLLGKVTIICVAQFVMIPRTHTKPHTFLNNNQAKGSNKHNIIKNYLTSVQRATDIKNSDTNSETIINAFNFHDIEYPVASTPRPQQYYFQDNNDNQPFQRTFLPDSSNIKRRAELKSAINGTVHNYQKIFKPNIKNNENKRKSFPKAFTSDSGRNVGNFPEVEYPLSAKDTWKPNFWGIPSDFKDLHALIPEDSQLNQYLPNIQPTGNFGIGNKSRRGTFSIKSYSDITKNKEQLKHILKYKANNINKKQSNSNFRNDFTVNSERNFTNLTSPIEEIVQEFHTTVMPYYLTTIHGIPDCENNINSLKSNTFSIESICNKTNQNGSCTSLPIQNAAMLKIMKTNNQFCDNNQFNLKENNIILLNHNNSDQRGINFNNIQEIEYDQYDILDIRKPEAGNDLSGLEDDYTTDVYSEEKNDAYFSHPITTPSPSNTVDFNWKNCKIITPCEYNVDELDDYYISV